MTTRRFLPTALLTATLVLAYGCAPARATPSTGMGPTTSPPAPDTSRITVTGTATVDLPADRARILLAVETVGTTAAQASASNAEAMERVLAAVRGPAGSGARIETSGYSLAPRYRQTGVRQEAPEIVGYRASNQLVVVVDQVDRMGGVLDAALDAGANRVAGLSFFASDTDAARLEALQQATVRAREEAEAVAEALGMVLLAPENIQTSASRPLYQPEMRAMAMQAADTPVEPGSQTVQATVTITWRLGPGSPR
jgi:uncharacterized protein YggE